MKLPVLLIMILCVFGGCNYDQVTTEYETYQQALDDDFFDKGWIPYELQDSSITKIFVRANLDVNTYIFSFNTEQLRINVPLSKNEITEPINIHGIDIPEWWNSNIQNKPRTVFPTGHDTSVNLVFDETNGAIYGWNEKSR